jgi:hypothetical protein
VGGTEHSPLVEAIASQLHGAAQRIREFYGIDGAGGSLYFDIDHTLTSDFPHMYVQPGPDSQIGIYLNWRMLDTMMSPDILKKPHLRATAAEYG